MVGHKLGEFAAEKQGVFPGPPRFENGSDNDDTG